MYRSLIEDELLCHSESASSVFGGPSNFIEVPYHLAPPLAHSITRSDWTILCYPPLKQPNVRKLGHGLVHGCSTGDNFVACDVLEYRVIADILVVFYVQKSLIGAFRCEYAQDGTYAVSVRFHSKPMPTHVKKAKLINSKLNLLIVRLFITAFTQHKVLLRWMS